eukprot:TRINITY_DN13233_c0_g1_i1.p1 TRINITY_DN13233_c0_g1~~TRINITY_DN13233_c0_g1_i1.p1  ORF type:complete len:519 (+),score=41.47 TRINITY_DN13233_c0_g1_i1:228-1559(+)
MVAYYGLPAMSLFLAEKGLYNDTCTPDMNATACLEAMDYHIAKSTILLFSVMECINFPVGFLLDYGGIRLALLYGGIGWTIGISIMGIYPSVGYFFYIGAGFAYTAVLPMFLGIVGELAIELSPRLFPSMMAGLLTGFCDLGTITPLILTYIFERFPGAPLWQLFLGYALVMGCTGTALLSFFWPVCSEYQRPIPNISQQLAELKTVVSSRLFWFISLTGIVLFLYQAFFFPMVAIHMRWHGATREESQQYLYIWSIMLPCLGFPACLIAGFGISPTKKWSICLLSFLQLVLSILSMLTAVIPNTPLWVQIILFASFIIWRMNGATLIHTTIPCIFPNLQYGKSFGLTWNLGGLVTVICSPFLAEAIQENIDNFYVIHITMGALSVLLYGGLTFLFYVDYIPAPEHVEDELHNTSVEALDDQEVCKTDEKSVFPSGSTRASIN